MIGLGDIVEMAVHLEGITFEGPVQFVYMLVMHHVDDENAVMGWLRQQFGGGVRSEHLRVGEQFKKYRWTEISPDLFAALQTDDFVDDAIMMFVFKPFLDEAEDGQWFTRTPRDVSFNGVPIPATSVSLNDGIFYVHIDRMVSPMAKITYETDAWMFRDKMRCDDNGGTLEHTCNICMSAYPDTMGRYIDKTIPNKFCAKCFSTAVEMEMTNHEETGDPDIYNAASGFKLKGPLMRGVILRDFYEALSRAGVDDPVLVEHTVYMTCNPGSGSVYDNARSNSLRSNARSNGRNERNDATSRR
jgi:hypothetical protein